MAETIPKVILFDIGGVCVLSPFRAILDYEKSLLIPPGYINFSISKSAPNGFWHKLERGEISLDAHFFEGFSTELNRPDIWEAFHKRHRNSSPKSLDQGLEYAWSANGPIPRIDGQYLFWKMMEASRTPDPNIYPALKKLKASKKFVVAALSNTVIFPQGHPYNDVREEDVRNMFDLFISSAHVGMRKPDPKIYEYTLQRLEDLLENKGEHLEPTDVVFLDDIGENLKGAKRAGMRTIRVVMGQTQDAVRQLEMITMLPLTGAHVVSEAKARL